MATWKIKAVAEAQNEFYRLPTDVRSRIRDKLRIETCREYPHACSLKGCPGWYVLRIGGYRIVYAPYCDEIKILLVTAVGLRDDVYREINRRYAKYG